MKAEQGLARWYLDAKRRVIDAGFAGEILWQADIAARKVTARAFAEEATWVVMSAGLSERVVRRKFPEVTAAMHHFDLTVVTSDPYCREALLSAFGHAGKVDAILQIARFAEAEGDERVRRLVETADVKALMQLPYIGPVTVCHLLKNLGVPMAKPDRHLVRLAYAMDRDVGELCREIADQVSEPVGVVDVVLWRWSVLGADA